MTFHRIVAPLLALFALLALFPAAASAAQPVWVQCAVEAYNTGVILTANSTQNPTLVQDSAGICTDWIQSGGYFGVDKYGSWRNEGYVYVCTISVNAVQGIDVYAVYGDVTSAFPAVTTCGNAEKEGLRVTYTS
jgi:hypothetical protein